MESDTDLLEAWCGGEGRAGEELFRRRVGEITRFFRNKVADESEVADLVSQTFLGLTEARTRFRGDASFRSFLYSIATNVLRGYIRVRYKRERERVDFTVLCIGQLSQRAPSSIVMGQRGGQAFVESLRDLSLDDQILLELKYFENLTGREIADVLGLPQGTVRRRLSTATHRLGGVVGKRLGGTDPAKTRASVSVDDFEAWAAQVRVTLGRDQAES